MGFFKNVAEKVKNFLGGNKTKKLPEASPYETTYRFTQPGNGMQVDVHPVRFVKNVNHSNGQQNCLILAEVDEYGGEYGGYVRNVDYITFEVSSEADINNENLEQILKHYYNERNNRSNQECVYVGGVDGTKSQEVVQYVDTKVVSEIRAEREEVEQRQQQRQAKRKQQQKAFDEKLRYDLAKAEKVRNQEFADRIRNPYLIEKEGYAKNKKDYDGVNLETGEILRIRELMKIGRDETGRYLYTAYLDNASNEQDVEIYSTRVPVCFTIDQRVEDIVAGKRPFEVNKLLGFLSRKEIYENNNNKYMNNIGALCRDGRITDGSDNSKVLKDKINEICQDAYQKMMAEQSKGNTRNN